MHRYASIELNGWAVTCFKLESVFFRINCPLRCGVFVMCDSPFHDAEEDSGSGRGVVWSSVVQESNGLPHSPTCRVSQGADSNSDSSSIRYK